MSHLSPSIERAPYRNIQSSSTYTSCILILTLSILSGWAVRLTHTLLEFQTPWLVGSFWSSVQFSHDQSLSVVHRELPCTESVPVLSSVPLGPLPCSKLWNLSELYSPFCIKVQEGQTAKPRLEGNMVRFYAEFDMKTTWLINRIEMRSALWYYAGVQLADW